MRLWTVHPRYLDSRGLCGLWREALLAQAVLLGRTRGYLNHPQLERFRQHPDPLQAIASYLLGVYAESVARDYDFTASKIGSGETHSRIAETNGQLLWEWEHLKAKLMVRSPKAVESFAGIREPDAHPMFDIVEGPIRPWERGSAPA